MASGGRISVLVSKELQTLYSAVKELPKEVNTQIRKHTRIVIEPVWKEAVRGHATTRLQTRVLSDTARVSVSDSNVILKAGGVGKLSSGVPVSELARATESGADRNSTQTLVSKKGKRFTRHTKRQFNLPRQRGYVVWPAASESIPRLVSLQVQTAIRTIHEVFEKAGR